MSFLELIKGEPAQSPQGGIQNPYKTSEQAYQQDVVPRAQRQGSGGLLDLLVGEPTPPAPAPAAAPAASASPNTGDFARGFGIAGKQLKQTAYGAAALIGDTVGSDGLKDWGLKGYKEAEKEVQAVSKPSDSFTTALGMGGGAVVDWLQYAGGYLIGQAVELGAATLAGAAVGGAVSGPAAPVGATAGAITGAVNKAAVQKGLRAAVGKMIDKEAAVLTAKYIAERGMAKEVAEKAAAEAAMTSVYRTIGARTAQTFLNATQELGSIYGEAVEEAAKTGEEYSLGKIWLSGIAATAVDTWADSKAVKGLTDAFKGRSRPGSIAIEAFKGGLREGLTEGVQTAVERWGADKDLATKEAFKEYIDSAAIGVLGGTVAGGTSGAVSKLNTPGEQASTEPNITRLRTPEDRKEMPVDFDGRQLQMQEDVEATLNRPDLMAALYMRGDETQRETIRRAVERAGLMNEFNAALQNPKTLEAQSQIVEEYPDLLPNMVSGLDIFANTLPDRTFKVDQRTTGGTLEAERKAEEEAARQGTTPNPPVVEESNDPSAAPKAGLPARTGPQGDTRNSVIEAFNKVGQKISGMEPGEAQIDRFTAAMDTLIQVHGFSTPDARAILGGKLLPETPAAQQDQTGGAPSQGAPNLDDQGALDEALDNASQDEETTTTPSIEIPVADPAALTPRNALTALKRLADAVVVDGEVGRNGWIGGEMSPKVVRLPDILKILDEYKKFDAWRISSGLSGLTSKQSDFYLVLLDRLQDALGAVAVDNRAEAMLRNAVRFESDAASESPVGPPAVFGKKAAAVPADTKPATTPKTESQQATEELKDALANLGDVLTDALGTKLNVTGRRYTAADLPDALAKVMSALVKAGYTQFKAASDELMKRMRANRDWAPLANKVDQGMLLKAWNQAGGGRRVENEKSPSQAEGKERPAVLLNDLIRAVDDLIQKGATSFEEVKARLVLTRMRNTKIDDALLRRAYFDALDSARQRYEEMRGADAAVYPDESELFDFWGSESLPSDRPYLSEQRRVKPATSKQTMEALSRVQLSPESSKLIASLEERAGMDEGQLIGARLVVEAYDDNGYDVNIVSLSGSTFDPGGVSEKRFAELQRAFGKPLYWGSAARDLAGEKVAAAKPATPSARQDTKPPSEEELLAAEISQLEADIEAENKRLTAKYGKGKRGTTDWTKAGVATGKDLDFEAAVKDLEKLEAMRDKLRQLVGVQREEAKFAKPASGGRPKVEDDADLKEDTAKTTYRKAKPGKPVRRRKLPVSELTPNMKRLLSKLNQGDQDARLIEWGSLSPEGLENAKREVDEIAERSDRRALERINETPRVRAFRARAEKIVSMFNDRQSLRDTVTTINQRIVEIEERLLAMKYVYDGGTLFEAISEEDENAYLWSNEQGLRIPKETSVEKLLALKRSLTEDLREARANSVRFGAAMIRRNIKRIEYELERARQEALEGLPQRPPVNGPSGLAEKRNDERSQIQTIYDDLRLSVANIMAGLDRPARTGGLVGVTPESTEEAVADTFDRDTAVYGILREVLSGKTKPDEATVFLARGMREGLFTVDDILRNAQVAGLSIPGDTIARYTNISLTSRMLDYTRANGYTPLARHQWLNAMHQVMRTLPGGKGGTTYELYYTDAERAAYEEWLEDAQNLALRRKEDPVMLTSMDPRNAFRGMLFIDYRLYQMRNPDMIENGRAREMLKGTIDNLPNAWHVDLYFALKKRPDLKAALFENELTDSEIEAHNEWLRQREAAAAKNVEVAARTPYFQELANLDASFSLEKGRSQDALERSKREDDDTERSSYYEKVYRALAKAKLDELDTVMAYARDLYKAYRSNKIDPDPEYTDAIDLYLEYFAAIDESRGGVSIEEFADSFVEGARENVEDMADSRGPMLSDEDSDAAPDYADDYDEDGNPKELRLRRGPYSGAVSTMNVVAEVADITSTWPNAPHVEVVQNVTQLPDGVRERVMAKLGAGPGAKGVYVDGRVYLFSDHLTGRADIEFTLFHEAYGHLGMRAALGNKFDQFLETAYRTRADVKKAVDALIADGMPKLEAIDEVLSDMAAENRNVSVVKQWVGRIISGLREIGFNQVADWLGSMTDAEVAATLNAARDAARRGASPAWNGAPAEIRFSKTARMPYEIFANKAGKATGYARYNPATDTWVVFTATGADIKDGHTAIATQDYDDVLKAMRSAGKIEYRTRSGVFVDDKIVADLVSIPKLNDQGKYGVGDKRFWSKWRRNAQIAFQNEYLPVFEVVDYLASIGRLTDQIDVKTALTLYERRTGFLVEQFRKEYVEPITKLVEQAGKLGVTKKDIDRYLTARHTRERNNAVAKVNPGMQDGGSGLTYVEALKIIAQVESSPAARVMSEIARKTDMMGKEKIRYLMDTGMITKAAGKKLLEYDHYVNLSGERDADPDFDDPGQIAGGSKFNVKGKEKRAFGRGAGNEAENVLARTIQAYEAALIRGQKNLVAQKVLALIETNYDSSFAIINAQPRIRQLNPETGLVEEVVDENYMARKDVMVAKINGIPSTIEFKDNTRGSFAEAIHGMVVPRTSAPIMEAVGKVTRMLGALLTTYNPAFTAVNFFRDVQTMYIQAAADGRITEKMARDMIRVLPKAIMAAVHEASGGRFGKGADPEMLRVLREMQSGGGITYFADRLNLEEQVAKIDALLSGKQYPGQKKVEMLLSILEFGANVSEIAPRLAAYKVVSDNGFSREQAATFSGEITVNFNMRGSSREMRQLFLFFNPAVQGGYKMYQLWKSPEGKKKFYGMAVALTVFGMLTSYIGRAVSGEDDDGIDRLDKVPLYKRATSVVISADSPFGAPLPIPYGWNAFFALGVFMADTFQGKQPLSVTAARVAKTAAEAFSPIGMGAMDAKSFETFLAKFVAPTILLPGVEFLANENRFGAPIRKEQSPFDFAKTPDAQGYFRGVSPISRGITDTLTELTGGSKYKAGGIDVNPSTIDFLIQSFLPGLPSDLYKGASVGIRAAQGEEIKRAPWPVLDRFSARIPTGYDAGAYRRAAEMVETVYKEYSNTRDQGRRKEIREEYPRLGYAHAAIASTKQELREIRQQITALEERKMSDEARVERRNQLLEREEKIFKRAVKRLMQAGDPVREAMLANE